MAHKKKTAKLDKGLNQLIKEKYYPVNTVAGEIITTTDPSKKGHKKFRYFPAGWAEDMAKKNKSRRQLKTRQELTSIFDNFETVAVKIPNETHCLKHFDKIIAPRKTLIPKELQKKYSGIQSAVFKKIKKGNVSEPNIIKYYTKNKSLTDAQCKILYDHEDWRGVHGFKINDRPLEGKVFSTYISWLINNENTIEEAEQQTYKAISLPVKTNADGSREPGVIQMGLNSYMKRNSLTNPVQIIDAHVKKEKLKIFDGINLGSVLSELNISPAEAFDYVCAYLNKNRDKKRLHTQDRELNRGASALKNLIDFYNAEKLRTTIAKRTDKKIKIFGYKELMNCKQYADYCSLVEDIQIRNYETFKRWIRNKLDAIALLDK
jgi:hypothetical protein